jgi:hypothetical protein
LLAFIVSLAGYYRYALKVSRDEEQIPSTQSIVLENVAAFFILAIYIGLGVWFTLNSSQPPWLPGLIAAAGAILLVIFRARMIKIFVPRALPAIEPKTIPVEEKALVLAGRPRPPQKFLNMIDSLQAVVSLDWMYLFLYRFFDLFRHLFRMMTRILEGEGGLLWALIIFILLITFMFRPTGGM